MKIRKGYTFDDLLLVPKYSTINSRKPEAGCIDTSVDLGKNIILKIPIVSANMKNITGYKMANTLTKLGGLPILHRFMSVEENLKEFQKCEFKDKVGCSIGVGQSSKNRAKVLIEAGCKILCIDVAHGDHILSLQMIEYIAQTYPEVLLIAGNVATNLGAVRLYNSGADVVKCGIGPGCFIAGTRILMADGTYENIEDIIPGQRIINKDGNPVTVLKSFCSGIKNVKKIRHTLFYQPTLVTSDHKYWVGDLESLSTDSISAHGYVKCLSTKTRSQESKYKWKEIQNVNKSCLLMPRKINFELEKDFEIKLKKKNSRNKAEIIIKSNYYSGYIFGTFLGDGNSSLIKYANGSSSGSVRWYFNKNEQNIVEKLKTAIHKTINETIKIKSINNIIECRLYYKSLAEFLVSFGKKQNKHLPKCLLVDNKEYLQGIYDGLIDSDGHIESNGRQRFTNTSYKLIELFNIVCFLLTGIFPNNEKIRPPTIGGLKNAKIEGCSKSFRASIIKTKEKRLTKIYQISKLVENDNTNLKIPVYDLEVDCDTHSFIANNAIVHNSLCSTRIETGTGVPQMTALEDIFNVSCDLTDSSWDLIKENYKIWDLEEQYKKIKESENKINLDFVNGKLPRNKSKRKFKIIADGGLRRSGDLVKALCFSDVVMLGSMLAGTNEAPGNIVKINGVSYKEYEGSSTHQTSNVEGVKAFVQYKGPAEEIIKKTIEGLRSGLSYQGCENLEKLKEDPEFIQVTNAGLIESHPHDVVIR